MPVAVFLTEISAPTITPPDASVIVPEIVAPVTCARSGRDTTRQNPRIDAKSTKRAVLGFMLVLLIDRLASRYAHNSPRAGKFRTMRNFGPDPVSRRERAYLGRSFLIRR